MTLGCLVLAVGILVDDATVTIENIERHLDEGAGLHDGILDGAAQIAVPVLVSTLCICIVSLPMFFLSGVARCLFVPLAEAVIFAMIASYVLSRTLVPTLAMYLLKAKQQGGHESPGLFARFHRGFEGLFETIRTAYSSLPTRLVSARIALVPAFLITCLSAPSSLFRRSVRLSFRRQIADSSSCPCGPIRNAYRSDGAFNMVTHCHTNNCFSPDPLSSHHPIR